MVLMACATAGRGKRWPRPGLLRQPNKVARAQMVFFTGIIMVCVEDVSGKERSGKQVKIVRA
jgi:hypothetical protein